MILFLLVGFDVGVAEDTIDQDIYFFRVLLNPGNDLSMTSSETQYAIRI